MTPTDEMVGRSFLFRVNGDQMKRRVQERHTTYFNLIEALEARGCALCTRSAIAARRYLDAMLYENVNDSSTRKNMAASLGFCSAHARMARDMNDAFGLSILYEALCWDVAERIQKGRTLPVEPCPVCNAVEDCEKRYIAEFCARFGEEEFRKTFLASDGFCLPHFKSVVSQMRDGQSVTIVRSHQVKTFGALAEELNTFLKKHDYDKVSEFGGEADAWIRCLEKFTGKTT